MDFTAVLFYLYSFHLFFFLACVNSETCFIAGVFSTNGGTYKFLKITHTHTDTYAQEKSRVESEITEKYIY